MEIEVKRIANRRTYCVGHLYVDGEYLCDTIEDLDRGLDQSWSLWQITRKKVSTTTAIPTGRYRLTIDQVSPKFGKRKYYKDYCGGKLPRLQDVKGFSGVLIHRGNSDKDSAGCLIVGYNTIVGMVTNSQKAFESLYAKLKAAQGPINITITRSYKA